MRRATNANSIANTNLTFQSTLSMRRATGAFAVDARGEAISIHALHEESDGLVKARTRNFNKISIHALHEESDICKIGRVWSFCRISIHALHEESDRFAFSQTVRYSISIHALHEESDCVPRLRGTGGTISIHALHEESDSAAGHFCPLFETQASCLALSISNNTADTTNNMSKTSNWLSVSF